MFGDSEEGLRKAIKYLQQYQQQKENTLSSFRTQQTCMNDQVNLIKTLESLGFKPQVHETAQTVRGHGTERDKAEIILRKEDLQDGGDIGFVKGKDGNFGIVMDTYVVRKLNTKQFMADVKQKYTEVATRKVAAQNGWTVLGSKEITRNGKKVTQLQFAVA